MFKNICCLGKKINCDAYAHPISITNITSVNKSFEKLTPSSIPLKKKTVRRNPLTGSPQIGNPMFPVVAYKCGEFKELSVDGDINQRSIEQCKDVDSLIEDSIYEEIKWPLIAEIQNVKLSFSNEGLSTSTSILDTIEDNAFQNSKLEFNTELNTADSKELEKNDNEPIYAIPVKPIKPVRRHDFKKPMTAFPIKRVIASENSNSNYASTSKSIKSIKTRTENTVELFSGFDKWTEKSITSNESDSADEDSHNYIKKNIYLEDLENLKPSRSALRLDIDEYCLSKAKANTKLRKSQSLNLSQNSDLDNIRDQFSSIDRKNQYISKRTDVIHAEQTDIICENNSKLIRNNDFRPISTSSSVNSKCSSSLLKKQYKKEKAKYLLQIKVKDKGTISLDKKVHKYLIQDLPESLSDLITFVAQESIVKNIKEDICMSNLKLSINVLEHKYKHYFAKNIHCDIIKDKIKFSLQFSCPCKQFSSFKEASKAQVIRAFLSIFIFTNKDNFEKSLNVKHIVFEGTYNEIQNKLTIYENNILLLKEYVEQSQDLQHKNSRVYKIPNTLNSIISNESFIINMDTLNKVVCSHISTSTKEASWSQYLFSLFD